MEGSRWEPDVDDLIVGCVVWGWRGGREKLPVIVATVEKLGEEGGMTRILEVVVPNLGPAPATGVEED